MDNSSTATKKKKKKDDGSALVPNDSLAASLKRSKKFLSELRGDQPDKEGSANPLANAGNPSDFEGYESDPVADAKFAARDGNKSVLDIDYSKVGSVNDFEDYDPSNPVNAPKQEGGEPLNPEPKNPAPTNTGGVRTLQRRTALPESTGHKMGVAVRKARRMGINPNNMQAIAMLMDGRDKDAGIGSHKARTLVDRFTENEIDQELNQDDAPIGGKLIPEQFGGGGLETGSVEGASSRFEEDDEEGESPKDSYRGYKPWQTLEAYPNGKPKKESNIKQSKLNRPRGSSLIQ